MSSSGLPPARAARCSAPVNASAWGWDFRLSANRITDPTSPWRTARSSEALTDVPERPTMIRCPSSFEAEPGTGIGLAAGLIGAPGEGVAPPPLGPAAVEALGALAREG